MKNYFGIVVCFLFFLNTGAQIINNTVKSPVTTTVVRPVIAFRAAATYVGGEPLANNTESKVNFTGAYFDESKNFSVSTGEFIAPSDGIYHFDLRVSWLKFSAPGSVSLLLRTNLYSAIAMTTVLEASTSIPVFDSNFSTLLKLKTGDKVSVYINQNSGAQQKYQQVILGGFKVN